MQFNPRSLYFAGLLNYFCVKVGLNSIHGRFGKNTHITMISNCYTRSDITTDNDMANILNNYFSSVFNNYCWGKMQAQGMAAYVRGGNWAFCPPKF